MKDFSNLVSYSRMKARAATEAHIRNYGENPMGCGFAWVSVKGVRGNKAKVLKDFGFKKPYVGTGLTLWNPSNHMTQDMDAKMAGAEAMAEALREIGFDAYASCRLD